jgi:hypothetical protein
VKHEIRVVKNVTISMDEETLGWVRVEAAKAGLSVSRWIAERLQGINNERAVRAAAAARMMAFLDAGPRFDLSENGKITIDRDDLYGDGRFRRFDHDPVHTGSAVSGQTGTLDEVAEEPAVFATDGRKPAGPE